MSFLYISKIWRITPMDDIKIRKAVVDDIKTIVLLLQKLDMFNYPDIDGETALRRVLNNNNAIWLVAVKDAGVVGSVRGCWDGSRAIVHQLAIDKKYHHQGIGKLLVDSIIQEFARLNIPTVSVTTTEKNRAFFEKRGFSKTEVFLMLKSLDT